MDRTTLRRWLAETDPDALRALWSEADAVRRAHVGDHVHLRGLLEVSNHCRRACTYCGIRGPRRDLPRYRMHAGEVEAAAARAFRLGLGTVVLQAGEDPRLTGPRVADLIRRIKGIAPLAVTLSLGERSPEELALWRGAGADRYLLRFETSNPALFARIHPALRGEGPTRMDQLRCLRDLGYEVGSGVMTGLPGQSLDDLARDLEIFAELDLDMVGVGPWIPDPNTPLGRDATARPSNPQQIWTVLALTRLLRPQANIPVTSAACLGDTEDALEAGLSRGANVYMPELTPPRYRRLYTIYPSKGTAPTCTDAEIRQLRRRLSALSRPPAPMPQEDRDAA